MAERLRVHVVSVGTEVTTGQIADSNAPWLAQELTARGAEVLGLRAVPDDRSRVAAALREALEEADWVVASGGLGPTADDLTREGLAMATGRPLRRHPEAEEAVRAWYARVGRPMPEANLRQADLPEGAVPLPNPKGTAPGVDLTLEGGRRAVLLPGPPEEMRPMAQAHVLGPLDARGTAARTRILRVTGVGESYLDEWLGDLMGDGNPSLRPYAKGTEVHLRLSAYGTPDAADRLLDGLEAQVRRRLGPTVYGRDETTLEEAVAEALSARRLTVSVAESLTGGELLARLTAPPGASAWVRGGVVPYGEGAKAQLLGLEPAEVAGPLAVRPQVARDLAQAVRRLTGSDLGVGLTGYAGPTAGPHEPVGRVYLAVVGPGEAIAAHAAVQGGDRAQVRARTAQLALELIRRVALGLPVPAGAHPREWLEGPSGAAPAADTDPPG